MSGANVPTLFIQLAFGIERHMPGYIDAYFGPPEWKVQAETGDVPPIQALESLSDRRNLLVVLDRDDDVSWLSLRNVPRPVRARTR